ncbi:Thymidylate kinase [Paenibacillus sp. UNCCL117]|uniref:hypothetical protein n=1 Tax=unclassified Paenibacillus TaxID=185978 RepID=UPI00088FF1A4|nr:MULTISPECIES: hypothetical protein [unclassified Paenibacillus]SDE43855.1 Thymidylate kinase [Paenibacillus sp. cl123]SFW46094.1 Thymidylate kinase [Paenibacillus sp. UNCCL117]
MTKTKLILLEGIPGSGKTTTSQLLYDHLKEQGIASNLYTEGCEHPIDLPFHAFLSLHEYHTLLGNYPEQTVWFKQHSIIEADYVLVPYKTSELNPRNDELVTFLSSREFCYTDKAAVPFDMFKKVFSKRFKQYVAEVLENPILTIFESVLFQHQIHDINRMYPHVDENEITEYIGELANIISPLNPVLFYISQTSVQESLEHTAHIRSKPHWSDPKTIEYYIKRKNLELQAINRLPFRSFILDNSDRNWDDMFERIKQVLSNAICKM